MQYENLKQLLAQNAERIRLLVEGITQEQARWKPDPGSWSILEVINHLYDEEREDFRARLDVILHYPEQDAPPIDPQGWVQKRRYNERDLEQSVKNFLEERQASLRWLETLDLPNWDARYEMPFGAIHAGDMFASWVAHDVLHMRQLVELHRAYVLRIVEPYNVDYAGSW